MAPLDTFTAPRDLKTRPDEFDRLICAINCIDGCRIEAGDNSRCAVCSKDTRTDREIYRSAR